MKDWMVPMRITKVVTVFVSADTPEEARGRAEQGLWEDEEVTDTTEWEIVGEPEENI